MSNFNRALRYVCLFVVLFTTLLAPFATNAQEGLAPKVRRLAQPYVDSNTVVGLSIGVLRGSESATVHLGKTKQKGPKPNDETIYEIGSVSKVFTNLLLADAVIQGKVKLEQNAQDLLPEGVTMPKWNDQSISLLDLATHSSGLPRLSDNMPFGNPQNPYVDYPSKLAHEFLNKHKLTRAPGKKGEYSNFGVALLGHMINDQAKVSYDELLKERLAKPLRMQSTTIKLTPAMKKRFATPYLGPDLPTVGWDFADMPGAGGIRSTTSDMMKFAKANLNGIDGELGKAIELAWKEHRQTNESRMGLGWHITGDGSRWHNGQTGGFHSMLMLNRKAKHGVVLLSNTGSMEVDRLAHDIVAMLSGEEIKPRAFKAEIQVDEKVMQGYVGRYELTPSVAFTISVEDGKMTVQLTGQPKIPLYAKSETEWFCKVVPAEITFELDEAGKCVALELFQNGIRQKAKRVE